MEILAHMFPISSPWCQSDSSCNLTISEALKTTMERKRLILAFSNQNRSQTTNLLFQASVSYAKKNLLVLFICLQPFQKLPIPVHGMPKPEPSLLHNVRFVYIKTADELLKYFSSVHMNAIFPDVMMIDGLDLYVERLDDHDRDNKLAKLCAFIIDAVNFFEKKRHESCPLLISFHTENLHHKDILKRFDMHLCFVEGSPHAANEFTLTSIWEDIKTLFKYMSKDQGLFMENVLVEKLENT